MIFVPIKPMGKPRMTQRDRWKGRPVVLRYNQYKDQLRYYFPGELPDMLMLVFKMPMPDSWSKKKKAAHAGQPHQAKPDIDNLCKGVMDALAKEDKQIWALTAIKVWTDSDAGIKIENDPTLKPPLTKE